MDKEQALLDYFGDDELAANVFMTKYALRDKTGQILETTPDQMHDRLAREFSRMEKQFGGSRALSYEKIRRSFDKCLAAATNTFMRLFQTA